jgi:HD-GYP domain-containing protein (c-di-GMP phosphodiesterase class II)
MAIRKNTTSGRLWSRRAQRDRAESALADLEQAHEVTVTALAAALELRDDETGGHAQRVTALALELAHAVAPELAADPELRYGFLLHDIGKIGIPDAILLKPMQLTPAEKRQMEFHTTLGEQLISSVPHLQGVAREVIAFHHERWDGTGYPWGLAGEAIPLAARIFAVADAFDAISNDRPYQRASSVDAALEKIEANAGTQFDPGLIGAFVLLVQQQFARLRVA